MFPTIPSSISPPVISLASLRPETEIIVDHLVHLYNNPSLLSSTSTELHLPRQQLSKYLTSIRASMLLSDEPFSPLLIKRHAWRAIDPNWEEKPRHLKLYDEEELIDLLYAHVIEKTKTQVAIVTSMGIGKRTLSRTVHDVTANWEKIME